MTGRRDGKTLGPSVEGGRLTDMCGFAVLRGSGAVVPDPRFVLLRRTMTATTDDLNKLHAMMMTKADEQDRKINS